jgi:hypothetical protein
LISIYKSGRERSDYGWLSDDDLIFNLISIYFIIASPAQPKKERSTAKMVACFWCPCGRLRASLKISRRVLDSWSDKGCPGGFVGYSFFSLKSQNNKDLTRMDLLLLL